MIGAEPPKGTHTMEDIQEALEKARISYTLPQKLKRNEGYRPPRCRCNKCTSCAGRGDQIMRNGMNTRKDRHRYLCKYCQHIFTDEREERIRTAIVAEKEDGGPYYRS